MSSVQLLDKRDFDKLFAVFQAMGIVYAPVKVSDLSFAFKKVETPHEIAFEALRTILPPKKFFYPPSETVIRYDNDGIHECLPEPQFQVIFGVHPCDLAGIGIMDTIFSAAPSDSHYLKRRESSLIVGLSCMPDRYCFCQSMGTECPTTGYDLFVTDLGDDYFLEAITQAGNKVLTASREFLRSVTEDDRSRYKEFWNLRAEAFSNGFAPDNLRSVMDLEADNKVWDEMGKRCLSCGNCTPVCPTCYCFDLVDVASFHDGAGERHREWDSCQFVGFAKVSGDFNFRPTPTDRLKFWYRHKLHGFDDPYGFKTCVGCGRCTVSCPAGIDDLVSVVKILQENRKKKDEGNAA